MKDFPRLLQKQVCYDWQMALAALWVLPITLVIVGFSKRAQNYFTRRQNAALIAMADGVQACESPLPSWSRLQVTN